MGGRGRGKRVGAVSRLKIVIGGMVSLPPFSPGTAWDRMAYVEGVRALGHEVVFVEQVESGWCRDGVGRVCDYEQSLNRRIFERLMRRFDLLPQACQLFEGGVQTTGLNRRALNAALEGADLLINISGHVTSPLVLDRVERAAYVDQDPVYTQLWFAEWGADLGFDHHDVLFTTGQNIGTTRSNVPTGGLHWHHTLPPVCLRDWQALPPPPRGRATTIASIGRYADLPYDGRWYRSKQAELERFADLPRLADGDFEIALAHPGEHVETARRLNEGGWNVIDAVRLRDLGLYRSFIGGSAMEMGVTKGAYIEGRAGWIGDRSCQYLAAARPVIAQATGLSDCLPAGAGLVEVTTPHEAAEAIARVSTDYEQHAQRARRLAEEHFAAPHVVADLIETALSSSPAREAVR